jgi:hypothetical protein
VFTKLPPKAAVFGTPVAGPLPRRRTRRLFGSAATGRMRPDSDIDLLVVRPKSVDIEGAEWRRQLESLSTAVTAWTGNDTRLLELDEDEVRRGLEGGERVLDDIRDHGVVLYGRAAYLGPAPRGRRTGRG